MLRWLKSISPRGLYSRLALIVLLPVLGLQLIISIAFAQRHFEDVTRQLTRGVITEITYILQELDTDGPQRAARAAHLGDQFEMDITLAPRLSQNRRALYDVSGRFVISALTDGLDKIDHITLCGLEADRCSSALIYLQITTERGPVTISLDRARLSASNPHQLFVIMIVLGGALTLVSFLYLRNQLRPIARLGHAAQAYGRGQILPYRIRGSTEVRAAGAAFLDMRARIERQGEARRLMLSGISHDLRTPLTRMQLALSMSDDPGAPDLLRDVEDMSKLLDAFLDFARDEASETPQMGDLTQMLRDAAADADRRGVQIDATALPQIQTSFRPVSLRRAVDNLINNAHRYANRAQITLNETPKTIQIIIDDDGPGIPAQQRDNALRPFYRLDPARNQNDGAGVGLGLAIVADVARSHGGRLALGDAPLGGLRAALILPK